METKATTAHEAGSWNQHRASTLAFAQALEGEPLSGRTAELVRSQAVDAWMQEGRQLTIDLAVCVAQLPPDLARILRHEVEEMTAAALMGQPLMSGPGPLYHDDDSLGVPGENEAVDLGDAAAVLEAQRPAGEELTDQLGLGGDPTGALEEPA